MRKLVVAVLMALLLIPLVASAYASTIHERTQFLYQQVEELEAASVCSNVYVSSIQVDLNFISTSGSVTTYTYKDGNPVPETDNFSTKPRSFNYAVDKITRYVLGNVANVYRKEPFNTEITMITHQRTTIPIYVYGEYKYQAIEEILLGFPTCFDIQYDTSSGRSDPVTPIEMPVAKKALEAMFTINSTTYTVNKETKTMDVAPEIKDNRTFVPIRYLAYALGVPEDGITWDSESLKVTIAKDETTVGLLIGQKYQYINGQPSPMDVTPYIKNGRTMLPARWVAEPLGATVIWDDKTKQVMIEVTEQGE